MTVKLLCDWGKYKLGNLVTLTAAEETGLVAKGIAQTDLTGGTDYVLPLVGNGFSATEIAKHQAMHAAIGVGKYTATYIALGDSRTQYGQSDIPSSNPNAVNDDRWTAWFKAFSQGRMKSLYDAGISGETSAQIAARVQADVIANKPGFCLLLMAANDPANGFTVAQSIANITATAKACIDNGIMPILFTESPQVTTNGGSTGQYSDYIFLLNAQIRALSSAQKYPLADIWALGVDPTSATGASKTNYLLDTKHFAPIYARAVGLCCWQAILNSGYLAPDGNKHAVSMADVAGNNASSRQVLQNPLFTGSGGSFFGSGSTVTAWAASTAYTVGKYRSNGGNVYQVVTAGTSAASGGPSGQGASITDGSVVWKFVGTNVAPSGWLTGPTVGSATAQTYVEARPDGVGNNVCLICTGSADGDACEINSGDFHTLVSQGDSLVPEMFVSLHDCVNVYGVTVTISTLVNGVGGFSQSVMGPAWSPVFVDQSNYDDLALCPQPLVIPLGGSGLSTTLFKIQIKFAGVGSCLLKVGRASVYH